MDLKFNFDAVSAVIVGGLVTTAACSFLLHKDSDVHPAILRKQSLVSSTRNPSESGIYRSKLTPHGTQLHSSINENKTSSDAFWSCVDQFGHREFVGYLQDGHSCSWISFKDLAQRVLFTGAGLVQATGLTAIAPSGSDPVSSNMVGIWLDNSPEWLITDYAAMSYGLVTVPIDDTMSEDALKYILNHTQMTVIVVGLSHMDKVFSISAVSPSLKTVIVADASSLDDNIISRAKDLHLKLMVFKELEAFGEKHPMDRPQINPMDIFTILYTFGDSGSPKGAMLRNRSIMASGAGRISSLKHGADIGEDDRYLSHLLLSNISERMMVHAMAAHGGKVGLFSGGVDTFETNCEIFQPTVITANAFMLDRWNSKASIMSAKSDCVRGGLFDMATAAKMRLLAQGIVTRSSLWDYLGLSKIQARMGRQVRTIIIDSGRIDPDTLTSIRAMYGVNIIHGYSLAQSCAAGLATLPGDYTFPCGSHVGVPCSSIEYKLVDIKSHGYLVTDPNPRGEICLRGPSVMKGYFKDPESTAKAIDLESGWLHSGDVGEVFPNGTLRIIDRLESLS
ncbi:hypothetical protein BASA50_005083 [Batrachochytrium salamandrivorans]|uniref:AMP-dependent synthetase/ligase domain-containing protein n=1 Tax=Batrachochytrium salamandrivorans TaxID=1357716 RepID=A0ABQ8FDX2_9FUNG|nr:hypothetical protein BASA60_000273 [Batrachochytrium salamandrivorans]KAH6584941.1 hypothetical protein BASA61_007162 [Batrachochytrium salamandrivorans]KAH6596378.1 hypothetical protein BASA50_005083 [Batrachochytrium salamandrivorans]